MSSQRYMKALGIRLSITALCAQAAACHGPTTATPTGYAGEWAGTTAQGRPIAFTISPSEAVMSITVGHDFNGCSGSQTFSGLSLNIAPNVQCIPGPCPAPVSSYHGFGYSSGNPFEGPSTDVNGLFASVTIAQGSVNFRS